MNQPESHADKVVTLFDPKVDIVSSDQEGIAKSLAELARDGDRLAYLFHFCHAARTKLLLPGINFAETDITEITVGTMKYRLMGHVNGRTLHGSAFFSEAFALKALYPKISKEIPLPRYYRRGDNCTNPYQFFNKPPFGGPFFLEVAAEQKLTYPEVLGDFFAPKFFDVQFPDATENFWSRMKSWQESAQTGEIMPDARTLIKFYGASNVIFDGKYPSLKPNLQERLAMRGELDNNRRNGDWIHFVDNALWMTFASADEVKSSDKGIEIVPPKIERDSFASGYDSVYLG